MLSSNQGRVYCLLPSRQINRNSDWLKSPSIGTRFINNQVLTTKHLIQNVQISRRPRSLSSSIASCCLVFWCPENPWRRNPSITGVFSLLWTFFRPQKTLKSVKGSNNERIIHVRRVLLVILETCFQTHQQKCPLVLPSLDPWYKTLRRFRLLLFDFPLHLPLPILFFPILI